MKVGITVVMDDVSPHALSRQLLPRANSWRWASSLVPALWLTSGLNH
jgi:hypothetical protein